MSHGIPKSAEKDLRKSIEQTNKIMDQLRSAAERLENALLVADKLIHLQACYTAPLLTKPPSFKPNRDDIKNLRDDLDKCIQRTELAVDNATDLLGQQHRLLNMILRPGTDIPTTRLLAQKVQNGFQATSTEISAIKQSLELIANKATSSSKIDGPSHWFYRLCIWITSALAILGAICALQPDLRIDPYLSAGLVLSRVLVSAYDILSRSRWGPVTSSIKGAQGLVHRISLAGCRDDLDLGPSGITPLSDPNAVLQEENSRLRNRNQELESRVGRLERIFESLQPETTQNNQGQPPVHLSSSVDP
ncbi:hypothetical protein FRC09_013139 [Ceratobasidium sp. 395]|nr:hypothetical protein FRC09_013139 [Ceratobasidium sp. 395]